MIVGFDKLGVSIVPTDEAYRVESGFSYLFLTSQDFLQSFTQHYHNHVRTEMCYGEQESLEMLEKALNEYKAEIGMD